VCRLADVEGVAHVVLMRVEEGMRGERAATGAAFAEGARAGVLSW
jgi:hypothetical protein